MEYSEDVKNLVKERLMAIPSNVRFSIGSYGEYTPAQLIEEIDSNTPLGKDTIEMHIHFIREMPKIVQRASAE